MNAVSLVPPEEWKEALRDYGCKPLEGKGRLNKILPSGGKCLGAAILSPFLLTMKDGVTGGRLIA
jgi:hypothetical protein